MAGSWDGSYDQGGQSDDSYHFERLHIEPIYDAFICPLTKQVMRDPVTLENGQTFEREAIEKWFRDCRENGRRLVCPVTLRELRSTELNPSIALRNTIEEWNARNEAAQLDMARRSLTLVSPENDTIQALKFVQHLCLKNQSNKHMIRNAELIPMIVDVLKSSSRQVRSKALETLRFVVEDNSDNKEIIAEGDTVRTIVKLLNHDQSKEREEAVSLLYELSKSEKLSEKIGSVSGAVLILVGMASSNSENLSTVEKAEQTLENLAQSENNVRQMAQCGRLQPLLTLLLEGALINLVSLFMYKTLPFVSHFMEKLLYQIQDLRTLNCPWQHSSVNKVLNNDVKVFVARTVGFSLINLMKSNNMPSREAALKALNQISSDEASAKVLIEAGILPPLVKDLFTVGSKQLPMRLKELSATILANVVNSGQDFDSIPVGPEHQTLVSEEVIHNLLHLISNTGPAIECKLLQVLVGLTSSPTTNLSPLMGRELASCLRGPSGQLGSLIRVISENVGITEEQAAAVGLLADLPERDAGLTRQMLDEGAFQHFISRIIRIRQGETRGSRFMTPYLEGLVKVLSRITFALSEESGAARALCREHNLACLFIDLLQVNGLDNVQMVSAMAIENLSQESKNLTRLPEFPAPGFCASIFPCLSKPPIITGLCKVHRGTCSLKDTFCLLEGQAVDKLVALLDHTNDKVLLEAEGVKPILEVLLEKRTDSLRRRAVWAVERLLRTEEIAYEVSGDPNISTALVDAFQHGDYRTRQIAERALKHVDKIPNFSGIFPNVG
ncbi:UNVERIFIED_CONTAM: U-box domain-containing protein 43 [Sesamum calycinum]|uniref:RING-type E3 ubiquitin transferase n=1 Tax=Sesamum calycinum TaxID=2727403 RepID=A0AAW2PC63_9LAMI